MLQLQLQFSHHFLHTRQSAKFVTPDFNSLLQALAVAAGNGVRQRRSSSLRRINRTLTIGRSGADARLAAVHTLHVAALGQGPGSAPLQLQNLSDTVVSATLSPG